MRVILHSALSSSAPRHSVAAMKACSIRRTRRPRRAANSVQRDRHHAGDRDPYGHCDARLCLLVPSSNKRARYRPDFIYSGRIEMLVWSIPAMTVLLVGGVAWVGSYDLDPPKPIASSVKPLKVEVVSLDWKWLFIYPERGHRKRQSSDRFPSARRSASRLTSSGVMNSFFVPQLGGQIYTMAGMVTRLHLQADQSGTCGECRQLQRRGLCRYALQRRRGAGREALRNGSATRDAGPVLDAQLVRRSGQAEQSGCALHLPHRSPPDLFDRHPERRECAPTAIVSCVRSLQSRARTMNLLGKLNWSAIPFRPSRSSWERCGRDDCRIAAALSWVT